jgi:HPr kinase/phosphorylase
LALIERGHSLVADDLTYIKLINETELLANSSELNRGYMECRGIGIINVGDLFGIRNVRLEKRIDLVVTFIEWSSEHEEDRTGLEESFFTILGIDIPHIEIYIRPGRDLARLVEVAAMVRAARIMGHDSAQEFNERLIAHMSKQAEG